MSVSQNVISCLLLTFDNFSPFCCLTPTYIYRMIPDNYCITAARTSQLKISFPTRMLYVFIQALISIHRRSMPLAGTRASLFDDNRIESTFTILDSRQCLPSDFNFNATSQPGQDCGNLVSTLEPPKKCHGAPLLALFYICNANRRATAAVRSLVC